MTLTQERDGLVVRTERLDLPLLPLELLDALIDGDRAAVGRIAPYAVPREFPGGQAELIDGKGELLGFLRFRRDQLRRDPERYPWSLRAIVHRVDQRMIGFVNFHGPPGVNDVAAGDAVELGWSVFAPERRKGYATETALALMEWAMRAHGIRRFISATTPDNTASLRVHEKLGFEKTGEIVDGELIFELRR
jgi:ribosomal-protein-alanine N-acetyltransferase